VKYRFQSLPFEFNLQRYTAAAIAAALTSEAAAAASGVGLCTLNQVDP
jgi:hypothetical protein